MADTEVWLPAVGYEGTYAVSNLGRIRREKTGRILRPVPDHNGYLRVTLSEYDEQKNFFVHVVVLTAFCGPPPFDEMETCHNDGVRANCRLTNIRWGYRWENVIDRVTHGRCRGEEVGNSKLTELEVLAIRARTDRGEQNPSIADDYGVSISTVHLIRHGLIWKHILTPTATRPRYARQPGS